MWNKNSPHTSKNSAEHTRNISTSHGNRMRPRHCGRRRIIFPAAIARNSRETCPHPHHMTTEFEATALVWKKNSIHQKYLEKSPKERPGITRNKCISVAHRSFCLVMPKQVKLCSGMSIKPRLSRRTPARFPKSGSYDTWKRMSNS